MSTYKNHPCRLRKKKKPDGNWKDHLIVAIFFILLVSLSLIVT